MPFESVDALKASEVFQRNAALKMMPAFRLTRFVEQFNRVHAAVIRRGGSVEEADTNAFALAFAAARRFQPAPANATVEEKRHVFATMANLQFSGGAQVEVNSFEYLHANIDLINAVVAGNSFNLSHKASEPMGMIHRILLPSEVSAEVLAREPDAPFFVEASYFAGTPDDLRKIETVSAEWLQMPNADGSSEVILPDSFAITDDPATDSILGVRRVAEANLLKEEARLATRGPSMSDEPTIDGLQARIATLEVDAKQAEALEEKLSALESRIAAVSGVEVPKGAGVDTVVSALENRFATLTSMVEEIKQASLEKDADVFAAKVFEAKEITAEATATYRALFLKDAEMAEKVAESIPSRVLKPGPGQAFESVASVGDDEFTAKLDGAWN